MRWVCALVVVAACGSDHHGGEPLGSTPIEPITYDAVFVVNGDDGSITVIDAERDAVAGTIVLAGVEYPHHVYLSPDGAKVAVAVPGADLSSGHDGGHAGHGAGGAVLVLDASDGSLLVARQLEAANHNAIFQGTSIWTTQIGEPGAVLVLDGETLETRQTIEVGDLPSEVTFSAAGDRAFVANTGSDTVTVLDPAGAVLATIPVGDAPVGAWPGSDGRMYVDNEAGKSLTVIDATTLAVVRTIELGFTPALAAVAPGGELWVADTDGGRLVFYDPAGEVAGELATGAGAHAIAFSADGAKAYVTNQGADDVSVIDVAGKTVSKTIPVGGKPNGITFRARP